MISHKLIGFASALAFSAITCSDSSSPTYLVSGYQGHVEGVVRARGTFAAIAGCSLSYSVSLLSDESLVEVIDDRPPVITDVGGNYDFDWVWAGSCPPGSRLGVRIMLSQSGFLPLDTVRVVEAPCETGSSFIFFSVFLTPAPPSRGSADGRP